MIKIKGDMTNYEPNNLITRRGRGKPRKILPLHFLSAFRKSYGFGEKITALGWTENGDILFQIDFLDKDSALEWMKKFEEKNGEPEIFDFRKNIDVGRWVIYENGIEYGWGSFQSKYIIGNIGNVVKI